jgi:hypothetical protein
VSHLHTCSYCSHNVWSRPSSGAHCQQCCGPGNWVKEAMHVGHALQQQARVLLSFFLSFFLPLFLPFFFLSLFTSLFLSFFFVSSILSFRKLRSHDISTFVITNLAVQWYSNTV